MAYWGSTSRAPVVVVPTDLPRHSFSTFGTSSWSDDAPSFNDYSAFSSLPKSYVSPSNPSSNSPSNLERRGRKRSRDEASENLDDRVSPVAARLEQSEEGWIYGPGMTLIKPGAGYVADASSQSGTWIDDKAAANESQRIESASLAVKQQEQERPSLRSNKSQRLDTAINISGQSFQSNRSSPTRDASPSTTPTSSLSLDAAASPVVDDFTLAFGIGWRLMNADSNISAAVRGWARFIENHYPVNNVKIHAESKGLQSYLVQASEGWFLFDENLRQGRLVSTDNQRCIQNLKTSPPVFESVETMTASTTPRAVSPYPQVSGMDMD